MGSYGKKVINLLKIYSQQISAKFYCIFLLKKFTEIRKNYCKIDSLQQHYDSRMTFTIILFMFIQLSRRYIKKNLYQK